MKDTKEISKTTEQLVTVLIQGSMDTAESLIKECKSMFSYLKEKNLLKDFYLWELDKKK